MPLRWLIALLVPLAMSQGQEHVPAERAGMRDVAQQADSLYFAFSPAQTLLICDRVFASGPDDAGLRWRAARAAIAMGMLLPDGAERRALYDGALRHARRAVELAPDSHDAWYWLAAAAGRRAHRDDPVYSARLGREVYDRATALLAVDSNHAGAHHALGMLHAEVLRVPALIRFVAGRVLRVDLAKRASWPAAEHHLTRAVNLDPLMIQYLVDLGDLHERAGHVAAVRELGIRLVALSALHPMDESIRAARVVKWRHR